MAATGRGDGGGDGNGDGGGFDGFDWSDNLISDLGPLLSLFGGKMSVSIFTFAFLVAN